MKHVSKLVNQSLDQTTSTGEVKATDQDKAFINELFNQLAGIFPAWKSAFDGPEGVRNAKRQWIQCLIENKITSDEKINRGLEYARQLESPFLPSVGQFVSWCKSNDMEEYKAPLMLDNPSKPETVADALAKMKESLN